MMMGERINKHRVRTHAAAWLAVSQPFGLADNTLSPKPREGMPQLHGLEFRRQVSHELIRTLAHI